MAELTPDLYRELVETAHLVRGVVRSRDERGDFDAAIAAIDHADAVGAVLDPTLYRDRHQAMAEDRAVLVALRDLARLGQERTGTAAS